MEVNMRKGEKIMDEKWEYYNIGSWLKDKLDYHRKSKFSSNKNLNVNHGEIWYCDLGYNIGTEKNKMRPVLVISNNKINNSEKVVVICITDAKGKVNNRNLPAQDSWYLLYSNTADDDMKIRQNRIIPMGNIAYTFLDKDSMVQCEEIKAVSKARLNKAKGCIGTLNTKDFLNIKNKFKRTYNI